MRLRHLLTAITFALATLSAHADVNPVPNPCALLNEQEATAVLGAPAKFGMKMDGSGMCMFNDAKGSPVLILHGAIWGSQADASEQIPSLSRVNLGKPPETVSGIGDHAVVLVTQQGDLMLVIQKQSKTVTLSLMHNAAPNLASRKLALEQAGKQIAGRL
jgi:hypothetical protein